MKLFHADYKRCGKQHDIQTVDRSRVTFPVWIWRRRDYAINEDAFATGLLMMRIRTDWALLAGFHFERCGYRGDDFSDHTCPDRVFSLCFRITWAWVPFRVKYEAWSFPNG